MYAFSSHRTAVSLGLGLTFDPSQPEHAAVSRWIWDAFQSLDAEPLGEDVGLKTVGDLNSSWMRLLSSRES